jgi:hypothetical protein
MSKEIVVLQRGWVVVGDVAEDTDSLVRLENASVVRRWGTTKGLGEMAASGPLSETVLDACPAGVKAHPLAIVMRMPCEAAAWQS